MGSAAVIPEPKLPVLANRTSATQPEGGLSPGQPGVGGLGLGPPKKPPLLLGSTNRGLTSSFLVKSWAYGRRLLR